MFEIEIYGEVVPFLDPWIMEWGGYVNLTHLKNELKKANGSDVLVRINSCGGCVETGLAMYAELRRYAEKHNAKITTRGECQLASIATSIFLAGDERIISEFAYPFVHNAWTYAVGDNRELIRVAADLERCNDMIARHYANHTNTPYEQWRELMDNSTSISPEEAVAMRFATSIERLVRPAALRRILSNNSNNKQNVVTMAKNKKNQSIKDMIRNLVRGQSRVKNKVVKTADQQELDFYELEDDATPQVGDKANFEGQPAEGEFTMADGEVYVFAEGELIEIREADSGEDAAETIEEVAEQVKEVQETVEEIQEAVVTLIEEIAPEIQNLRKENNRLSAIVNKLKNASSEAPKGSHERVQGTDNKNSKEKELDSVIANIKKSKFKKK